MSRMPILAMTILLSLAAMPSAFAGSREDFVKAVKDQCGKSQEEAETLATPGREGTIAKFTMCAEETVVVSDTCKPKCKKSGSTL